MFFVLVPVLFKIKIYVLNNFFAQYKHTKGTYQGLLIIFYTRRSTYKRTLHILRWTSAVCLQWARGISRSRGRVLYRDASRVVSCPDPATFNGGLFYVKGGRVWARDYIAGRAAYMLGPPHSRGGVMCRHVKVWRSTWNTYLVWRLNVVVR